MAKRVNLFITFLIVFIASIINITSAKAETYNFEVAIAKSDGSYETVEKYQYYWDAYWKMSSLEKSATSTPVMYRLFSNSKLMVNCTNCIAKVNATDAELLYLYKYSNNTKNLTYIATDWGTDAVFLEYDNAYGTARIKISGAVGWVDITDIDLVPVSTLNTPRTTILITGDTPINVRTAPDVNNSSIISSVSKGETYVAYETKNNGGYIWYKINKGGNIGWVASLGDHWVRPSTTTSNLNTYYYINGNNDIVHSYDSDMYGNVHLTLNPNPGYLKQNVKYYSFDSNYFYTDIYTMIEDDKAFNHSHALNAEKPFYAYFMYLPAHSRSAYSAGNFDNIISLNYNANTSKMYGMGYAFLEAQDKYGVNALQAFSKAAAESAYGTSRIAMDKNNLFGMGAVDGDAYNKAKYYNSPYDSIMDYGATIGKNSYTNPWSPVYHGGAYGNKGSGLNVKYASDQYWGENQAAKSYNYDKKFGSVDINSYTLGIKQSDRVINLYKKPASNSDIIYQTKNYHLTSTFNEDYTISNMSFIVIDKVNGFYKVYTDPALDNNQKVNVNLDYTFTNSYGWIKEEDLYVDNTQPTIEVNPIIETTQGEPLELNEKFTCSDKEDKINNKKTKCEITDNPVDYEKIGEYQVTVTATDSQNFNASKTFTVKVNPSLKPTIEAEQIEVSQFTEFNYLDGVKAYDKDTDLIDKVVYTKNVDTSVLGNYSVVYTVVNKYNISTELTRTVIVVKNKAPEIIASNKIISVGDTFNYLDGIQAIDKEDGDISKNVTHDNTVDTKTPGIYNVTYTVKDSANNTTTKTIQVTVEEIKYINNQGVFYLNGLVFNEKTNRLEFSGFLTIKNINNTKDSKTKFDMILINQDTKEEIYIGLDRWLDNVPFTAPSDKGFDYSGSWFTSSIDLSLIPKGDYSIYVRSRIDKYQTRMEVTNAFFSQNITNKINLDGRGYLIQTNYTSRTMGIELFIRDYELLGSGKKPTIDNMYNQVYSIDFNGNNLNIMGTSHNVNGDYASKQNVERYIYIENILTKQIVKQYNVGSITNGPYVVSLRVSDGLNKTKAWYNAKLDISDLDKGRYIIYVRTKTKGIDDYGELSDSLYQKVDKNTVINGKTYKIERKDNVRYRLELTVE